MTAPLTTIYHLALPTDWAAAKTSGVYAISTRGRTLDDEGFIHCSRDDQVEAVANNFYADVEHLTVLTIDVSRITDPVVEEPPFEGADDRFPHIYGPIPSDSVAATFEWHRPADAPWVWPKDR